MRCPDTTWSCYLSNFISYPSCPPLLVSSHNVFLMKEIRICLPQNLTYFLAYGLFWAEDNRERAVVGWALCPLSIHLKAWHKLPLWSCLPHPILGREDNSHIGGGTNLNLHGKPYWNNPYIPLVSLCISTFPPFTAPGSPNPFSLSWHLFHKCIAFC